MPNLTWQAETLVQDIQKKIGRWNEHSQFTIKGVKNLSRSDMDMLDLYARHFMENQSFEGLIEPRGDIKQVLMKYGFPL